MASIPAKRAASPSEANLNLAPQVRLPPGVLPRSARRGGDISPEYETSPTTSSTASSASGDPAQPFAHQNSTDSGSGGDPYAVRTGVGHGRGNSQDSQDLKKPRACESCRGLKVKCEPVPDSPDAPCKRCNKAGRECVVTAPVRKRAKKTDSRVSELEQRVESLTAVLQSQPQSKKRQSTYADAGCQTEVDYNFHDPVVKGIITMDMADQLFERYTNKMVPHLPCVVFHPEMTARELRRTKPYLFLSIMAAASGESPEIQTPLVRDMMRLFAEKIFVQGQKSLEMVQALQVSVIWYWPPENFEELKFYLLVHLGVVMAYDLGLGRQRNPANQRLVPYTWRKHPLRPEYLPDPITIEARRAWLSSWFLCSNVAIALHRPNLSKWSDFHTECMDILETSPAAAPSDKALMRIVWVHRLTELTNYQLTLDDPSVVANVADPRVQFSLQKFTKDLKKYCDAIPRDEMLPSFSISVNVLKLYTHEIALQVPTNENSEGPEAIRDPIPGLSDNLTSCHIDSMSNCLEAIDEIFDVFLAMDCDSLRCLPVFNFVRVAYGVVVLMKMFTSAINPGSELGTVFDPRKMKVTSHIENLHAKFAELTEGGKSRAAAKFLNVLALIRNTIYEKLGSRAPGADANEQPGGSGSAAVKSPVSQQQPEAQQQPPPQQNHQSGQQPPPVQQQYPPSHQHPPQQQYRLDQQHRQLRRQYQQLTQSQGQQAHQQNLSPNSTSLQLLSEVATNPDHGGQANNVPMPPGMMGPQQQSPLPYAQAYPYGPVPAGAPDFPGPQTQMALDQTQNMWSYLDSSGLRFDLLASNGFEHAMGLTLGVGGLPGYGLGETNFAVNNLPMDMPPADDPNANGYNSFDMGY